MGKLELIIGPMFSGKSTRLISKINNLKILNKKILILKPKIDDRYGNDSAIISHDKNKENCLLIDNLDFDDNFISMYDVIAIDEAHFLKGLKKKIIHWVEKLDKEIILTGLDGDYKREPIGEILDLIPYADTYKKLKSLCTICKNGTKAIFTHRICNHILDNQILVGDNKMYESLCREHYILNYISS
jgi:thymidine kinase